jgi:DNA repair ATPase RecN
MSPRKSRAGGQSRQQLSQRLKDRRVHEETLLLEAADALARRNSAEALVAEAVESLNAALDELQRHGFDINDIAELLEIDPSEINAGGSSRRVGGRTSRPGNAPEATPSEDTSPFDPPV